MFDGNSTLFEIKEFLSENKEDGVECPCCEGNVKVYRYTLNQGMAKSLICAYRHTIIKKPEEGWYHPATMLVSEFGLNPTNNNHTKLQLWGLIEPKSYELETGMWRITNRGERFIRGSILLPKWVKSYFYDVIEQSDELISIQEAHKIPFNLDDILNSKVYGDIVDEDRNHFRKRSNPNFSEDSILKDMKDYVESNVNRGVICPCCENLVKVRKETMIARIAKAMVLMYKYTMERKPEDGWIHLSSVFLKEYRQDSYGLSTTKAKYFGLIEPKRNLNGSKVNGVWRLTDRGKEFVKGKITVPKSVIIFRDEIYGYSEKVFRIEDAFGEMFSLDEVMNWYLKEDKMIMIAV